MAFDIGERVTSTWTGPGVVVGLLERDEDGVAIQMINFDSVHLGMDMWEVGKLRPLNSEDEPKAKGRNKIQKEGGNGTQA